MKNYYRALVQWYLQGNPKYQEKNLSQYYFVHFKSLKGWPGI